MVDEPPESEAAKRQKLHHAKTHVIHETTIYSEPSQSKTSDTRQQNLVLQNFVRRLVEVHRKNQFAVQQNITGIPWGALFHVGDLH